MSDGDGRFALVHIGIIPSYIGTLLDRTDSRSNKSPLIMHDDPASDRSEAEGRARLSSTLAQSLKSTYSREMHLSLRPSRQVIEIAANATALRADHKPTFALGVWVAGAQERWVEQR
jgi:hypothetical protein